ncbi:MAG: DUF4351 domain-containing protein [Cyanobacteria bacterium SBLK]|nr:DUF4351 domain-containing protein [Cyanobacteria bacterium SBLK]
MSDLKRYWIVIHYETELEAESDWDACHDIRMGNTVLENASIAAKELPFDANVKEEIAEVRIEVLRKAMVKIILRQLSYKTDDYSFLVKGLPPELREKFDRLSLEQLDTLSIEVLDFTTWDDLNAYLQAIVS